MGVLSRARRSAVVLALAILVATGPAPALETDQFYAWKRPLRDSTEAINRKINAEIEAALDDVNTRLGGSECPCTRVQKAIRHRFSYLIFLKPELWVTNTSQVDRVPATPEEELRFRHEDVYGTTGGLDPIHFMPPSPTILVNGVRIGTDKISHFFSEGAWMFVSYRFWVGKGRSDEEAVQRALALGLASERTILGGTSSGVLSLADIEANFKGLTFWKGLCRGDSPALVRDGRLWKLARPFDFADYVTPEWDESWQPNVYTPQRWKHVKPVLEKYCPLLDDPEIAAQRAAYEARSSYTVSERVLHDLVVNGKLADPRPFTIDAVCGRPSRDVLALPPIAPGENGGVRAPLKGVRPGER